MNSLTNAFVALLSVSALCLASPVEAAAATSSASAPARTESYCSGQWVKATAEGGRDVEWSVSCGNQALDGNPPYTTVAGIASTLDCINVCDVDDSCAAGDFEASTGDCNLYHQDPEYTETNSAFDYFFIIQG